MEIKIPSTLEVRNNEMVWVSRDGERHYVSADDLRGQIKHAVVQKMGETMFTFGPYIVTKGYKEDDPN